MSLENVEIVRSWVAAFNRGDLTGVLELCAPEVEWWDRRDDPDASVRRGYDENRKALAELDEALAGLCIEPHEFIDAGEHVVVPIRLRGRRRASGVPFEEQEVHVFRLCDGKISEGREYREKDEALKAVGLLPLRS